MGQRDEFAASSLIVRQAARNSHFRCPKIRRIIYKNPPKPFYLVSVSNPKFQSTINEEWTAQCGYAVLLFSDLITFGI
jgi:hypothetical protein